MGQWYGPKDLFQFCAISGQTAEIGSSEEFGKFGSGNISRIF